MLKLILIICLSISPETDGNFMPRTGVSLEGFARMLGKEMGRPAVMEGQDIVVTRLIVPLEKMNGTTSAENNATNVEDEDAYDYTGESEIFETPEEHATTTDAPTDHMLEGVADGVLGIEVSRKGTEELWLNVTAKRSGKTAAENITEPSLTGTAESTEEKKANATGASALGELVHKQDRRDS